MGVQNLTKSQNDKDVTNFYGKDIDNEFIVSFSSVYKGSGIIAFNLLFLTSCGQV